MLEELKAFEKTVQDKRTYRRYLCIWLKAAEGKTAVEIAEQVGFHWRHVQRIWKQVADEGLESLRPAYKGGGRQLLDTKTEAAILSKHEHCVGVAPIRIELEEAVGAPVSVGMVYALLKRHGWKAKRPRPKHPKADQEAQSLFKKTP